MVKPAAQWMMVVMALLCSMFCITHATLQDETCTADGEPCVFQVASQGVAADAAANDSATSLLQRQHRQVLKPPPPNIYLALEGGGHASLTLFSGFFTGLLNVLGQETNTTDTVTFANSNLFQRIYSITSISGGSWMASGLIYSSQYKNLLESIARNTSNAITLFDTFFVQPMLDVNRTIAVREVLKVVKQCFLGIFIDPELIPNDLMFALFEGAVNSLTAGLPATALEDMFLFSFFWKSAQMNGNEVSQYSWHEFVRQTFSRAFLINDDITLGSPPNDWAIGKLWVPVVSQVNPARGNKVFAYIRSMLHEPFRTYFTYNKRQSDSETPDCINTNNDLLCDVLDLIAPTWAQALFGPHLFTPARFSITLGSTPSGTAPLKFCDDPETCGKRRNQYIAKTSDWPFWKQIHLAPQTVGEFTAAAIDAQAGKLPVNSIAAASSALNAATSMFPFYGQNPTCSTAGGSVSIGNAPNGNAFKAARDFITNERYNAHSKATFNTADLRTGSLMSFEKLADGAYTDNTGVMTAVGEGATEVFAVFYDAQPFIDCFFNPQEEDNAVFAVYHIFQETRAFAVWQLNKNSNRLYWPIPGIASSKYLKAVTYGSFTATTRDHIDSRMFGVTPNRSILIDWVNFESTIGILEPIVHGSNTDAGSALAEAYNDLLFEILSCMTHPGNRYHAKRILNLFGLQLDV